jgi:hypothetical protein
VTTARETFQVGDVDYEHEIGNDDCGPCWMGYPQPCDKCDGLVHADWGDEDPDDNYWLYTKCDRCGDSE